jgi:CDP-4-dehydro-6-deoxyglucose reductase, E1
MTEPTVPADREAPGPDLDSLRREIGDLVQRYAEIAQAPSRFEPGSSLIPASGALIGAAEFRLMTEAVLQGWLTIAQFNAAFERELAEFLGVSTVLTCNSGSSADLLAISALTSPTLGDRALRPGDEVITLAAAFPTTVNAVVQNRLVPVFVDLTMPTYNVDVTLVEPAIGPRTRAIAIAHTLGNPFNVTEIERIAKRHDLWLIEDACDALGSTYQDKAAGSFGDVAAFSFFPAHHITMGEGGAVAARSEELGHLARSFRDWGRDCRCPPGRDDTCGQRLSQRFGDLPHGYDHKYVFSHMGYNLKITEIQAACGLAQLGRLPAFTAARKRNFGLLANRLKGLEDRLILPEATPGSDPAWLGFPITLREEAGTTRLNLVRFLEQSHIGTRLLFGGNLIRQPYFSGIPFRVAGELANTDRVTVDTFWLGLHPAITEEQVDYMGAKLEEYFRHPALWS